VPFIKRLQKSFNGKKRTNENHAKKQESLSRFLFRPQMKKKRSPILLKKKRKTGSKRPITNTQTKEPRKLAPSSKKANLLFLKANPMRGSFLFIAIVFKMVVVLSLHVLEKGNRFLNGLRFTKKSLLTTSNDQWGIF